MNYFSAQPSISTESGPRAPTVPHRINTSRNPTRSEAEPEDLKYVEREKQKSNELDHAIRQILENKVIRASLHLPNSLKSIALLSVDYGQSGALPSASLPSASAAHFPGALNQVVGFLKEVDAMYRESEPMTEMDLLFTQFRERVEKQPIYRFKDEELEPFERGCEDWQLIELGAAASFEVYGNGEKVYDKVKEIKRIAESNDQEASQKGDAIAHAEGDIKAYGVYKMRGHGRDIIVVAVRGSVGWLDWLVNFDGEPRADEVGWQLSYAPEEKSRPISHLESALLHKGLRSVALAMEEKIATAIEDVVGGSDGLDGRDSSILFTGHSAGGAVAQLFYQMGDNPDREMFKACKGFRKLHCITFGTPPISTSRISVSERGLFLNVINEGDPVVLAQKEYASSLLEVYLHSMDAVSRRYPEGFRIPDLPYKVSGSCVLLRYMGINDFDQDCFQAWVVKPEKLEKKLFGNILVHDKKEYLDRVRMLAEQKCKSPDHECGIIPWERGQPGSKESF